MKAQFEEIYSKNKWGHGSGDGSKPQHTKRYVALLQKLLREHNIKSVVDMGCGDWQFSQFIDWTGINYQGFDIVSSVIEANKNRFASSNLSFQLYSGNGGELPAAELLIAKDVLQHWPNESVTTFLPNLKRFKFCLITNCVNPDGETQNSDIEAGGFRYLDLRLPPFNVRGTELLSFTNNRGIVGSIISKPQWRKKVLFIENNH